MKPKYKPLLELNRILSDKTSGSTDLVLKLNKWIKKHSGDLQLINEMIRRARLELKSFAAIDSYLKKLKRITSSKDSKQLKISLLILKRIFKKYIIVYTIMPVKK
jgi:tRNA isopentenyl-2-thiomethyl-A-37 hydroxylase MiaE